MKEEIQEVESFKIIVEWKEKDGQKYPNVYTFINIKVKGEENRGYQKKAINVKFNKLIDLSRLRTGFLTVYKCNLTKPYIYEVKIEDGKKKYPYIFVDSIFCFEAEDEFFLTPGTKEEPNES